MSALSLSTLAIAIVATAAERERLLARIAAVPRETDVEEHLSERVMDIDRALGELGSAYEELRSAASGYPSYEALLADAAKA